MSSLALEKFLPPPIVPHQPAIPQAGTSYTMVVGSDPSRSIGLHELAHTYLTLHITDTCKGLRTSAMSHPGTPLYVRPAGDDFLGCIKSDIGNITNMALCTPYEHTTFDNWGVLTRQRPRATICTFDTSATDTFLAHWLDGLFDHEAIEPLTGYERYTIPNWDTYSAQPISHETLNAARAFIRNLPPELSSPEIAPGSDGTIGLEWNRADGPFRTLFIDIGPGRTWNAYLRRASGEKVTFPHMPIDENTNKTILDDIIHL